MSSEGNINQESLSKTMRIFLLLATIIIISITVVLMLKKPPAITQAALQQEIQSLQQQLPIRLNAQTELRHIEAGEMEIQYTFVVMDDPTQQSSLNVKGDGFAQQVERAVKTSACINKNTKRYINSNISLSYLYTNQENTQIASFVIPAGYCKK
ncbi:MAG: hypothetical protein ACR2PU_02275 [Gammaproteobacteria bacterium]